MSGDTCPYHSVAASKVLHVLLPEFFMMWDNFIAPAYGAKMQTPCGEDYVYGFYPHAQLVAHRALDECCERWGWTQEQAEQWLRGVCGHTLAKVIDEYGYVKYTLGKDAVWWAEYSPPSDLATE